MGPVQNGIHFTDDISIVVGNGYAISVDFLLNISINPLISDKIQNSSYDLV